MDQLDLSVLNEKQKQAVTAPLGPVLVLAGAGSGKTRVLTYRIAYLIEQNLVAPEQILAVTFTNKAAKEMRQRISQLLGSGKRHHHDPVLGTFHSIGARLLRKQISKIGYSSDFTIYDSEDQLKTIKEIAEELQLDKKLAPSLLRSYISSAKNQLQTPDEFNLGLPGKLHQVMVNTYRRYQDILFLHNAVDFDDLLMLPIRIFQSVPEVLEYYRQSFRYILVDEYQDTNRAQYVFLSLLSSHRNLFVVGDDAQSIYRFRGSTIANILNFEHDYPEALVVKLEQNYRSTKNILAAAQKVIDLNAAQKSKVLWTDNESGPKVVVEQLGDGRAEALFVTKKICQLSNPNHDQSEEEYIFDDLEDRPQSILDHYLKANNRNKRLNIPQLNSNHLPLSDYAVLYRTHAQSRVMEEALIEAGIPYQIIGGIRFYERKEIKDALAYIRLIVNPRDFTGLKRIINEPARGIGPKSYQTLKNWMVSLVDNIEFGFQLLFSQLPASGLSLRQQESASRFFKLFLDANNLAQEAQLTDLLKFLLKQSGYEQSLRDGSQQGEVRAENLKELFNVTAKFDHLPWRQGVTEFLQEVALVTDLDNSDSEKDVVTLMTLHSAKGLEFPTVFFIGLEEGLLPHSQSLLDPEELAEEIRLAYVGLTRARKQLYLLYARTRQVFGNFQANLPSRILSALPPEAVAFGSSVSFQSFDRHNSGLDYEYVPFE